MTDPVEFTVSIPEPDRHLIEVRIEVPDVGTLSHVDLRMPVWSPGSYKVRDYSRHVQNFRAKDAADQTIPHEKTDKATWRIDATGTDRVVAHYRVFAHTLNVREKHVDATHVFFQPTAVYMYPEGRLESPALVELRSPREDWEVYCSLDRVGGNENQRRADDFHALFDAPVEIGDHEELDFEVDGVPHRMAFWGEGNWERDRLERDLPEIVAAHADLFGEIPYDDYLFITLLSDGAYGGLEHCDSTSLLYPQNEFGRSPREDDEPPIEDDDYLNFLSLVSHELFHAWNVKRMYPEALETFDYQSENYVSELWTIEGITSFYDRMALHRAGLVDADRLLEFFSTRIADLENTPGRHVQSLREAGHDAWVKLYQSDEQTVNSTVSYYLKGALVALVLDLRLHRHTDGEHSLDDLVRHIWREYGPSTERGYPDGIYRELAEDYAETSFREFFDHYIHGTSEIDWSAELEPFGLVLERARAEESPRCWIGVTWEMDDGALRAARVRADGPAYDSELDPGDEIAAVDGWRVEDEEEWNDRMREVEPGETVEVLAFRRGRTVRAEISAEERPYDDYAIRRATELTDAQRRRLEEWLGTTDIETTEAD